MPLQRNMDTYWRTRQSMIARMHSLNKLPKVLRQNISLRPEDELLLVSGENTELYGDSIINLKSRAMRKKYQSALFFSTNKFQITSFILHKFPGDSEEKSAEIHYDVAVNKSASYLLREGLISNHMGMNEIDTISLGEIIKQKISLASNDLFGRFEVDEMRDSSKKLIHEELLGDFLQRVLSSFGMDLVTKPLIVWSETSLELLESFKSARREEITANEELMLIEQEEVLSNANIEARKIAQKKLKKKRRQLVKKEREYLNAQLESNYKIKSDNLDHEREKFLLKKSHDLELLKKKMQNELSDMEIKRVINERYAEEEKRIVLEQEKANIALELKRKNMDLFYEEQEREIELDNIRAENIGSMKIISDFEREQRFESSKSEIELKNLEQEMKNNNLKQLIEMKAMLKENKGEKEILRTKDDETSKSESNKNSVEITGNIIGGDLNLNNKNNNPESSSLNQKISENIISGDLNMGNEDEEN